jgi:hypothetical protein
MALFKLEKKALFTLEKKGSPDFDDEFQEQKSVSDKTQYNVRQRRRRMKIAILSGSVILALIMTTCAVVLLIPASLEPTESPSQMPSLAPSGSPSMNPSDFPSNVPSGMPSGLPSSSPSGSPSMLPSTSPSSAPSKALSGSPSESPTGAPTGAPSTAPSEVPTERSSELPSTFQLGQTTQRPTVSEPPSQRPSETPLNANFYVIGDLPYSNTEKQRLVQHVDTLPENAEFLVHVGDIRAATNGTNCTLSEFEIVGDILKTSSVPVFIVPGGMYGQVLSSQHLRQSLFLMH